MNSKMIRSWLLAIDVRLAALAALKAGRQKSIVFTLSTTSKSDPQGLPYLTPLRETLTEFISGVVVRSIDQGALVALALRGKADLVFVDAEAKRGLDTRFDSALWQALGIDPPGLLRRQPSPSLVEACQSVLSANAFFLFKPNDLTVESVWHFLDIKIKGPQAIGIFGAGNIGFKLALKLVEAGHSVGIHRRDQKVGHTLVEALEAVKPVLSTGRAYFEPDAMTLAKKSGILVGTSDGAPVITEPMIACLDCRAIIIDVGKGTISPEGIQCALKRQLDITRTDVTSGLQGFLASHHRQVEILNHEMGRNLIAPDLALISGGFLGHRNDVIVDHFKFPRHVIGLADGRGDLIRKFDAEHLKMLERVHLYIAALQPEKIS